METKEIASLSTKCGQLLGLWWQSQVFWNSYFFLESSNIIGKSFFVNTLLWSERLNVFQNQKVLTYVVPLKVFQLYALWWRKSNTLSVETVLQILNFDLFLG